MLQYLIILLDDTSTSYCHYESFHTENRLIKIEDLKAGIFFGMKENLMIQFVYPDYELPQEYKDVIDSIDHYKIMPSCANVEDADIIVFNSLEEIEGYCFDNTKAYALRTDRESLFSHHEIINQTLSKVGRLNLIITDIDKFGEPDFEAYKVCLNDWSDEIEKLYIAGMTPQLNVLTDRLMLDKMNNCGAGDTSITLATDGRFYVCPGFYYYSDDDDYGLGKAKEDVGTLHEGVVIKNHKLYRISHAPICRNCDSYHCKRCVWLNRKTTLEVNTPSHEQCVVSHLERNRSRILSKNLRDKSNILTNEIIELTYLDPYENRSSWQK